MAEQHASAAGYVLGIDLGTTYSAAAIARGEVAEPFVLGTIAAQIPSVVVHRDDGQILVGEAAERRAGAEPTRAAREFKRRLGDPIPVIVGGTPYGAESLMAQMLEAIVRQVTEREGQPPATIVLTHPANYSDYKRGLLHEAARLAGLNLEHVRMITEPEAAAISYAHHERIEEGEIIAVYDFGGGTFDAAVVRGTATGFELIGVPEGMERLGGIDVDQAVLAHVDTVLDGLVSGADASDPNVVAGQARLRDECRSAKEALSSDTDATIPVSIPGVQTQVRLTRDELEGMVRPRIAETVNALQRTIASAGLGVADISRVLLVGGTSRMPIVAQTVRDLIGRPISVDADPKLSIAIGAALSASQVPVADAAEPEEPTRLVSAPSGPRVATPARRRGRLLPAIAAALAAAALAVVAVIALGGGGKSNESAPSTVPGVVPTADAAPGVNATAITTVGTTPPSAEVVPQGGTVEPIAFDAGSAGAIHGLGVASNGDVYVATAAPSVMRLSGGAGALVPGLPPDLGQIGGLAVGSDGAVFVSTATGITRVVDGQAVVVLDSATTGLSSQLGPLALDGGGNLFIADNGTSRIVRLAPDGGVTLVAGTGTAATAGSVPIEQTAAATSPIGQVVALAVDGGGHLLIADTTLLRVRSVSPDGTMATVAGGGSLPIDTVTEPARPAALDVSFTTIESMASYSDGRLVVVTDTQLVRVDANGVEVIIPSNQLAQVVGVRFVAVSPSTGLIVSDGSLLWSIAGDNG